MAAVTVTKSRLNIDGSRRQVIATMTLADTNTWATKLKLVEQVDVQVVASNQTVGVSAISGGTVTFAVANGPVTGARVIATGY